MPRWVELLRRTPCLVLLLVQLAGVLLYPTMETSSTGRSVFALFGLLVLALVLLTLRVTPFITWVATLGALPAAGLLLVSVFVEDQGLFAWSAAFEMAVYFYAALSMLAYMLQDDEVTTDELFAIPAVFTLLAGRSRSSSWWSRPSTPVVSTPTAWAGGRGWNCSSSRSPPSPARAFRTSRPSPATRAVSSCSSRSPASSTSRWWSPASCRSAPPARPDAKVADGAMSTLELSPEPQSVRRARSWIVAELAAIGRDD